MNLLPINKPADGRVDLVFTIIKGPIGNKADLF